MGDPPNRKRRAGRTRTAAQDDALKLLNPLTASFDDFDRDANRVSWPKIRKISSEEFVFYTLDEVHLVPFLQ